MKRSQLWIEGAQWLATLVGQAEGEQMRGICSNVLESIESAHRPPDFVAGVRAMAGALMDM